MAAGCGVLKKCAFADNLYNCGLSIIKTTVAGCKKNNDWVWILEIQDRGNINAQNKCYWSCTDVNSHLLCATYFTGRHFVMVCLLILMILRMATVGKGIFCCLPKLIVIENSCSCKYLDICLLRTAATASTWILVCLEQLRLQVTGY